MAKLDEALNNKKIDVKTRRKTVDSLIFINSTDMDLQKSFKDDQIFSLENNEFENDKILSLIPLI